MAYASGLGKKPPGKREEWSQWSAENDKRFVSHAFEPHVFLHTIGALDCCKNGGCWMTHVVESKPEKNCKKVVRRPSRPPLPKCLDVITPELVVEGIMTYENRASQSVVVEPLTVHIKGADAPPPEQINNPVLETPPPLPVKKRKLNVRSYKRPTRAGDNGRLSPAELNFTSLTFPITVCALTYGKHDKLAIRCLSSIYNNLDPSLFRLRFGFNSPTQSCFDRVMAYLEDKSNVEKIYKADPQIYKYPMMRQMFWDPDKPLQTDWVMWLDDDSHIVDPNWIKLTGHYIDEMRLEQNKVAPRGYHCFGKVYYWHFRGQQINSTIPNREADQIGWVEEADWFTGRDYALDRGKVPPMPKSDFATGGWWLVTREAIKACNWPDQRIVHRGGDIMFGAALWQQGLGVAQVAGPKPKKGSAQKRKKWFEMVKISDAKQRGYNENIAGVDG